MGRLFLAVCAAMICTWATFCLWTVSSCAPSGGDSANNNIVEPSGIVWKAVRKPPLPVATVRQSLQTYPNLFFYA
jgi:hypothetical protein